MWLMTKHGFYSIVQKAPGTYHVRAREKRDLQNLINRVRVPLGRIIETRKADYRYRLLVDGDTLLRIMEFLGDSINYDNFKAEIARTPDQARKPYHQVWSILAYALGAYGARPGGSRRGAAMARGDEVFV
ncbi:MAG: hypothetical protein ACM3ZC_13360 [Bacteroidota bacterium]